MASRKFKVKFVDGKACVEKNQKIEEPKKKLDGKIMRQNDSVKFVPNTVDEKFDDFFEKVLSKIFDMRLSKKHTSEFFQFSEELITESFALYHRMYEKEMKKVEQKTLGIISKSKAYILNKIASVKTTNLLKKKLIQNKYYVAPIEKSMGLKWKNCMQPDSTLSDHRLAQTTFQVVMPSETITKMFTNAAFKKMFFEYNEQKQQTGCNEGVFNDYCCGNVAKTSDVLRSSNTVVLQFGTDEVDVCCGLKSKATIHKIFAVYFTIRNIPTKYASRLENIYLAALCNSANFKDTGRYEDDVIKELVRDLRQMEMNGIDIGDKKRLNVVLFDIPCDNLGANNLFGFSGSFSATNYCRFCTCSKAEAHLLTTEDISKIRSVSSYDEQIMNLAANPNLDLKETKGVKKKCLFNDLENFHVCQNISADVMHDVLEGAIPYFLKSFLKYCIDNKICDENCLIRRVRDFNYGTLNSKNKPSKLRVGADHLGQNATQYKCIMLHLPFIFLDKKNELKNVWPVMESLLHIVRILFSYEIHESDLQFLVHCVKNHLSGMINIFGVTLKPKHHNLIHYARVIREMGPVRYSSMMRYEAKHKFFTDVAKKTNNFINITKTLAEVHQSYICTRTNSFEDRIESSKKQIPLASDGYFSKYTTFTTNSDTIDVNNSHSLYFLKFNGIMYKKGYFVLHEQKICEIVSIIRTNETYFLLSHIFEIRKFDSSLNSIEIKKTDFSENNLRIINVNSLNASFEKKIANGSIYVIMENLEMLKSIK